MKKSSLLTIAVLSVSSLLLVGCGPTQAPTTVTGAITQIEQGKDGKQITIITDDDKTYTTAVSMTDTVVGGTIDDLAVGTVVSVSVDEMAGDLLMGDSVEIVN